MKKAAAILASAIFAAGAVQTAQAGAVLIPYFTTQNGTQTLINFVNRAPNTAGVVPPQANRIHVTLQGKTDITNITEGCVHFDFFINSSYADLTSFYLLPDSSVTIETFGGTDTVGSVNGSPSNPAQEGYVILDNMDFLISTFAFGDRSDLTLHAEAVVFDLTTGLFTFEEGIRMSNDSIDGSFSVVPRGVVEYDHSGIANPGSSTAPNLSGVMAGNMDFDNPFSFDSVIMFYPFNVASTYIYALPADIAYVGITNGAETDILTSTHMDFSGGIAQPNNYYWTLIGVGNEDNYRGFIQGIGAIGPNVTGPFVFDRSEVPYSALQPVPVVCAGFLPVEALLTSGTRATLAASGGWFTINVITGIDASSIGLSPQNRDVAVPNGNGINNELIDTSRYSRGAYLFKIESAELTLGGNKPFTIRALNTYPISTSRY